MRLILSPGFEAVYFFALLWLLLLGGSYFYGGDLMKKFKILSTLLVFVMIFGLASCGTKTETTPTTETTTETPTESAGTEIKVVDMMDRELTFAETPKRVVAITPSNAEILFAIGAGETLVGRGKYVDYPEAALAAEIVESGKNLNAEQVLALEPDLVLMSDMAQTNEQVQTLTDAGATVVMTDAANIEEVYESIVLIGQIMGKNDEANTVIEEMKSTFAEISKNKDANAGKTIYFEISPLQYGLWTGGNGTFMQEIADIIGVTNIFEDLNGWAEVSEEQVLERNPDYIMTISMYFGEGPTPIEEIKSRPGWENITAVKEDRILNLVNDELSRPAPRLKDGAKALADFISER